MGVRHTIFLMLPKQLQMSVPMVRMPCLMRVRDLCQKRTRILRQRMEIESVNRLEEEVDKNDCWEGSQCEDCDSICRSVGRRELGECAHCDGLSRERLLFRWREVSGFVALGYSRRTD